MHAFCDAKFLGSVLDKMRKTEKRSGMVFKVGFTAYIANKYIHICYFKIKQMLNLKKLS